MLGSPLPNGRPVTPQCLTPNLLQLFEMPANGFMPWDSHAHCVDCAQSSVTCAGPARRPQPAPRARGGGEAAPSRLLMTTCVQSCVHDGGGGDGLAGGVKSSSAPPPQIQPRKTNRKIARPTPPMMSFVRISWHCIVRRVVRAPR